jgi:hypothetical protein
MKRIFQVAVVVLVVAFCFGQMALAENVPHYKVTVVPSTAHRTGVHSNAADTNNLYALWSAFAGGPEASYASPFNTDGYEIWPCFGGGTAANTDCPSIGNPTQDFATTGVVVGAPFFTWPLSFCDQTTTTALPCGQTETWYEDDSADTTDDLLYSIVAQQGTSYIVDSGQLDLVGPNPYGAYGNPGVVVIISGDQGFGTMGQTGVNNGNCFGNYNYPLTSNSNPGVTYAIASGKTCVAPVSGLVTFTAITELGLPKYTKSTSGTVCGVVGTPCYTVKFTKKKSITQKWTIWLD